MGDRVVPDVTLVPYAARMDANDRLLTPGEVAAMFRVDPKTVTRWAKVGRIKSTRTLGGHRRFSESEVRARLEDGFEPDADPLLKDLHAEVVARSSEISADHESVKQADQELRNRLSGLRDEPRRVIARCDATADRGGRVPHGGCRERHRHGLLPAA